MLHQNKLLKLLHDDHFGPTDHVFIIDKHTLPFTYKFGLNLILESE